VATVATQREHSKWKDNDTGMEIEVMASGNIGKGSLTCTTMQNGFPVKA
jgi:hypothetical protein